VNRFAIKLLICTPALCSTTVAAVEPDWQVHGFAAQGFSVSHGNEFYGDSRHGSSDFYELGLSGAVALRPHLLFAAQGLMRRAGATDTEGLRLDYAQAGYEFLSSTQAQAGLRLGRVKNPYGLYNDTRDVVFTRPGIALPDAVYLENIGLRSLLFSGNGAQLYGNVTVGEHQVSAEVNYDLDHEANNKQKLQITGGLPLPNDLKIDDFYAARVVDDWNGGRLRLAASYLHARLALEPDQSLPFSGAETFGSWVFSTQYNLQSVSLTGEYFLSFVKGGTNFGGPIDNSGDGFYLQADWRVAPAWTAVLRYSASFADRHDRDGRAFATQTGGDRYARFAHDEMLGLRWLVGAHWGFWIEGHLIQGEAGVPALDNRNQPLAKRSSLMQLMAAYRF
jgi:hypothetical protein